jgi:hypothetical protein
MLSGSAERKIQRDVRTRRIVRRRLSLQFRSLIRQGKNAGFCDFCGEEFILGSKTEVELSDQASINSFGRLKEAWNELEIEAPNATDPEGREDVQALLPLTSD